MTTLSSMGPQMTTKPLHYKTTWSREDRAVYEALRAQNFELTPWGVPPWSAGGKIPEDVTSWQRPEWEKAAKIRAIVLKQLRTGGKNA